MNHDNEQIQDINKSANQVGEILSVTFGPFFNSRDGFDAYHSSTKHLLGYLRRGAIKMKESKLKATDVLNISSEILNSRTAKTIIKNVEDLDAGLGYYIELPVQKDFKFTDDMSELKEFFLDVNAYFAQSKFLASRFKKTDTDDIFMATQEEIKQMNVHPNGEVKFTPEFTQWEQDVVDQKRLNAVNLNQISQKGGQYKSFSFPEYTNDGKIYNNLKRKAKQDLTGAEQESTSQKHIKDNSCSAINKENNNNQNNSKGQQGRF